MFAARLVLSFAIALTIAPPKPASVIPPGSITAAHLAPESVSAVHLPPASSARLND